MSTTKTIKVGRNRGGVRVWLQGLDRYGWTPGERVSVTYGPGVVLIQRDPDGKRKVSAPSKGGVLDIVGASVTGLWHDAGEPAEAIATIGPDSITIAFYREG